MIRRYISAVACLLGSTTRRRRSALLTWGGLIGVRPPTPSDRIQGLWRDVGTVRPHDRAAVDEVPSKEVRGLERLEHGAFEPLRKVDSVFGTVVEDHAQPEATMMFSLDDAWEECHGFFSDSGALQAAAPPSFSPNSPRVQRDAPEPSSECVERHGVKQFRRQSDHRRTRTWPAGRSIQRGNAPVRVPSSICGSQCRKRLRRSA
jgi:hypothetical protein